MADVRSNEKMNGLFVCVCVCAPTSIETRGQFENFLEIKLYLFGAIN